MIGLEMFLKKKKIMHVSYNGLECNLEKYMFYRENMMITLENGPEIKKLVY